jgi:hypothetical protein
VLACAKDPLAPPDRDLDAGEVERLWKTDRAALAKVSACLRRLVCQDQEVREEIGRVEAVACELDAKPGPPTKGRGKTSAKTHGGEQR